MLATVDPITLLATLAVGYAAVKLLGLAMSPYIPTIWVPLKPGKRFLLITYCSTNNTAERHLGQCQQVSTAVITSKTMPDNCMCLDTAGYLAGYRRLSSCY